jgi:hypothetical protein
MLLQRHLIPNHFTPHCDNIGKVKIIHEVENNPNTPAIEIVRKFNRHLYPAL